jgi:hypothetical protein
MNLIIQQLIVKFVSQKKTINPQCMSTSTTNLNPKYTILNSVPCFQRTWERPEGLEGAAALLPIEPATGG